MASIADGGRSGARWSAQAGRTHGLRRQPRALLRLRPAVRGAVGPGGDEPHYLIITQSLLADGDLKIENNHSRRGLPAFFGGHLRPDFMKRGQDGEIYSIHAPGLSALLLARVRRRRLSRSGGVPVSDRRADGAGHLRPRARPSRDHRPRG